ncbi:hypothetical protein P8452_32071 [Trifolium repens]|nr:hypothetical protein P8452_32071 [Trifolium repens]
MCLDSAALKGKRSVVNLNSRKTDIEDQNDIPPLAPIQHLDKPPDKAQNTVDANKQADMASPSNQDNEGFKLVTSRSSKRIDKVKASTQKNVHITKSKILHLRSDPVALEFSS